MWLLLVFALAVYAVKSDDNYYVIEMPEYNFRDLRKPYNVYWNVPTMQCKSKGILFEDLYEKYGITQNNDDSFRGDKIAILYDPGLFPALLKNETSGLLMLRNGGVPQEGDLEKHLMTFRHVLNVSVPDPDFNGIGIIDFESWRPIFRQNFGVLSPYQNYSIAVESNRHWWWSWDDVKKEARKRFEESGRVFMETTLRLAKQMRPKAAWGYYGFPYCFNVSPHNMHETCARGVPRENDDLFWLWQESTALYPSVYSHDALKTEQLVSLIRGRLKETQRNRRNSAPVLPYFWFRYRDGGFLREEDLNAALDTLYTYASGFIIWGSSTDVNSLAKCRKLKSYVDNILGPALVKRNNLFKDYDLTDTAASNDITTMASSHNYYQVDSGKTTVINSDTLNWPSQNTKDEVIDYVDDIIKEPQNKTTTNVKIDEETINEFVLSSINNSVLMNLIVNFMLNRDMNEYNSTHFDDKDLELLKDNDDKDDYLSVETENFKSTVSTTTESSTFNDNEHDYFNLKLPDLKFTETTAVSYITTESITSETKSNKNLAEILTTKNPLLKLNYTSETIVTTETDSTTANDHHYFYDYDTLDFLNNFMYQETTEIPMYAEETDTKDAFDKRNSLGSTDDFYSTPVSEYNSNSTDLEFDYEIPITEIDMSIPLITKITKDKNDSKEWNARLFESVTKYADISTERHNLSAEIDSEFIRRNLNSSYDLTQPTTDILKLLISRSYIANKSHVNPVTSIESTTKSNFNPHEVLSNLTLNVENSTSSILDVDRIKNLVSIDTFGNFINSQVESNNATISTDKIIENTTEYNILSTKQEFSQSTKSAVTQDKTATSTVPTTRDMEKVIKRIEEVVDISNPTLYSPSSIALVDQVNGSKIHCEMGLHLVHLLILYLHNLYFIM